MTQRQTIAKLTTPASAVVSRRFTYDRCQLVAAHFVCAGTWLAHQSSTMKQYRCRSDSSRQEKECPLCQQFGRGPCKDVFYTWYDCTEEAAGSGRSEDEITEDCAKSFDAFRACLDRQATSTSSSEQTLLPDVDVGDLLQLRDAWHQIIHFDLASVRRDSFPSEKRPVIKKSSNNLLVSFSQNDLVLVFVQRVVQTGETEVVAAAAAGDLIAGTIRVPSDRLGCTMIVSAVYETPASNDGSGLLICEEQIECDGP